MALSSSQTPVEDEQRQKVSEQIPYSHIVSLSEAFALYFQAACRYIIQAMIIAFSKTRKGNKMAS
jgi:hypothetical protein